MNTVIQATVEGLFRKPKYWAIFCYKHIYIFYIIHYICKFFLFSSSAFFFLYCREGQSYRVYFFSWGHIMSHDAF